MGIAPYQGRIEALRPLAERWRVECNNLSFGLGMDTDYFLGYLHELQGGPQSGLLVLTSKQGRPLGFMGILVNPSPLSGQPCANETMWYVVPEHRSLAVTRAFIDVALSWGVERGCCAFLLTSSQLANKDAGRVARMYERMGFKLFETVFIRGIE